MNLLFDSGCYPRQIFGESFNFLLDHGLLQTKQYLSSYKVVFVGEVRTPYAHFFALPKNFTEGSQQNIQLIKTILKEFASLKRNGKLLLHNRTYHFGGEIDSEFHYWRKLYEYFTDYLTYEAYYPKNRITLHSNSRQQGRLNPMLTEINRDRYSSGLTYEIKDYQQDQFRNMFYSVLKHLEEKYATVEERKQIATMEDFLQVKKIPLMRVELNGESFIDYTKTLQTNPVHEVIKKTLVHYFLHTKISEKFNINVFYTKRFEYVCEYLIQQVLGHQSKETKEDWINPDFKKLYPDIITEKFIGDVKYYNLENIEKKPLEKELYAYNIANSNNQPNLLFLPGERTKIMRNLKHQQYNLQLISVNLHTVLRDFNRRESIFLSFILEHLENSDPAKIKVDVS